MQKPTCLQTVLGFFWGFFLGGLRFGVFFFLKLLVLENFQLQKTLTGVFSRKNLLICQMMIKWEFYIKVSCPMVFNVNKQRYIASHWLLQWKKKSVFIRQNLKILLVLNIKTLFPLSLFCKKHLFNRILIEFSLIIHKFSHEKCICYVIQEKLNKN